MTDSRYDAVLVRLWNDLEPLRLAGDEAGLDALERAAARIARDGNEAQRREAERVLEAVARVRGREREAAAVAARPAATYAPGDFGEVGLPGGDRGEPVPEGPEPAESEQPRVWRRRLLPLIWVLVVVVYTLANLFGRRD